MSTFTCKCGQSFDEESPSDGSCGLLKPLGQQVGLEAYQAKELADLFSRSEEERKNWPAKHFGPEYPSDWKLEELIEDFLYSSHRKDGCSATFTCPSCGRLALLHDVNQDWHFYVQEPET